MLIGPILGLSGCGTDGAAAPPGADLSLGGLNASALSERTPDFESPPLTATGRLRDLDSAISAAMTACELGLVEQLDTPLADSPSGGACHPGSRTCRFITMRDHAVWLRVNWEGTGANAGGLVAGRTDQTMEIRSQSVDASDGSVAKSLAKEVAAALKRFRKKEF